MSTDVKTRVDEIWGELGIFDDQDGN